MQLIPGRKRKPSVGARELANGAGKLKRFSREPRVRAKAPGALFVARAAFAKVENDHGKDPRDEAVRFR